MSDADQEKEELQQDENQEPCLNYEEFREWANQYNGASATAKVVKIEQVVSELSYDLDYYLRPKEIQYCEKGKVENIAGHIVAKEAIAEMLGQGQEDTPWHSIEIGHMPSGQPIVHLGGQMLDMARKRDIDRVVISLSHGVKRVAAFAMGLNGKTPNLYLGIDISSVHRIAKQKPPFFKRIYTPKEVKDATGFAEQWGVKEAIAKALGTGVWREGVNWNNISAYIGNNGLLTIELTGEALQHAEDLGIKEWNVHINQSLTNPVVFVIGAEERT